MTEPARILIVDDNEMNRDMLARRLERDGHEVILAESGPRALECLMNNPVDLMLLDIMMPQMSGYEVLERVKENSSLPYIPVIIISAVSDLNSVVRCIEIGAEDYLFKPFNPILLKARVDASLARKRLSDWQQQHLAQLEQHSPEGTLFPSDVRHIADASVLVMEVVDIDRIATAIEPEELVNVLNGFFVHAYDLAQGANLTITRSLAGICRISSDITQPDPEHACVIADVALAIRETSRRIRFSMMPLTLRMGIGSGPLTAGMIETGHYLDVWGEAAHGAQQAMRIAPVGGIGVSLNTFRQLPADRYVLRAIPGDQLFYDLQHANR
ncbi:MAG: response regulator [Anaerolineaceae bacterium]|nr:response regulator [Anaerolineaceae bacterium]